MEDARPRGAATGVEFARSPPWPAATMLVLAVALHGVVVAASLPICDSPFAVPGMELGMRTYTADAQNGTALCPPNTSYSALERRRTSCLVPTPSGYRAPGGTRPGLVRAVPLRNLDAGSMAQLQRAKKFQHWVRVAGDSLEIPQGSSCGEVGLLARGIAKLLGTTSARRASPRARAIMLDMGCGVASLDAALLEHGVAPLGVAPVDAHAGQMQVVSERGVPYMVGVVSMMERLPLPAGSLDVVYCCWCRASWPTQVAQLLRPGAGFFLIDNGHSKSFFQAGGAGRRGGSEAEYCMARHAQIQSGKYKLNVFRRLSEAECAAKQRARGDGRAALPACTPAQLLDARPAPCLPTSEQLGSGAADGADAADGQAAGVAPRTSEAGASEWARRVLAHLPTRTALLRALLVGDDGRHADALLREWRRLGRPADGLQPTVVSPLRVLRAAYARGWPGYADDLCAALPHYPRAFDLVLLLPTALERAAARCVPRRAAEGSAVAEVARALLLDLLRVAAVPALLSVQLPAAGAEPAASAVRRAVDEAMSAGAVALPPGAQPAAEPSGAADGEGRAHELVLERRALRLPTQ